MKGSKSRNRILILLAFMIAFSLGIIGRIDSRLHIGGSDWDYENYMYVYIDDILAEGSDLQDIPRIDGLTGVHSEAEVVIDETEEVNQPQADQPESTEQESTDSLQKMETAVELASASISEINPPAPEQEKPEEKRPSPAEVLVHTVRAGETVWDIANAYDIDVDTVVAANNITNPNRLQVGQELNILSVKGVYHQVASGESLWEIAQRYRVSIDSIAEANAISDPSRIQPNTKIVIPGATQLLQRDLLVVNGQLQRAFSWPTTGRISSPFGPRWGRMHNGIDLAVVTGTPIRAAADGRVTYAGWNGGYGILVIVDHGNNVETRYAHNSRLNVSVGQQVQRGQVVSYSGNTGNSTGPHLHFEIRYRNQPVNPQQYLR